jgi:hypothetical protein
MSNTKNGLDTPKTPDNNDNALFLEDELVPQRIDYAIAAGGANVCEVTLSVQDGHGDVMAKPILLDIWLSDDSEGEGLTGTAASGTVTAKSASGEVFGTLTAKKALQVQTKADGTFILEITDSSKTTFYVAAQLPVAGIPAVSRILATGDYGT